MLAKIKLIPFPKSARLPWDGWRRNRVPAQVTALDVDGQTLRVVVMTPKRGRAVVTRLAAAPLELLAEADRSDPALLGRAIAKTLATFRLKPTALVMGVPRAQVVLRTLALPVLSDVRELASMVHFQVGRDLPFRLDEAVIDFKVRRQIEVPLVRVEAPVADPAAAPEVKVEPVAAPAAKLEVLVAAVKRDVVEFYQQTAAAAGVKLAALGLLSYANARCLDVCNVAAGDEAVALVSLRPDELNIDVIAQQTLLFSRGASVKPPASPAVGEGDGAAQARVEPAAADGPAAPPETFAELVTIEVVRSLHSYSGMEPQNAVAKVAVTGATGHEGAVVQALAARLNIPCSHLDLAAALELAPETRDQAPGGIAPIGLALGVLDPQGLPFDFLNPKRPAVKRDLRRIRILGGVAAAAAALVFTLALRSTLMKRHEAARREVADELAEAEQKSPLYRRMIRQAATVEDWNKGGRNWLEHIAHLSAILPPSDEVYVTTIAAGAGGSIRFGVQARSGETLATLEKQLRAAGYDVKPLAITPGADRHGYEFRSSIEIVTPEKMKIEVAKLKVPSRPLDDASLDPAVSRGGRR